MDERQSLGWKSVSTSIPGLASVLGFTGSTLLPIGLVDFRRRNTCRTGVVRLVDVVCDGCLNVRCLQRQNALAVTGFRADDCLDGESLMSRLLITLQTLIVLLISLLSSALLATVVAVYSPFTQVINLAVALLLAIPAWVGTMYFLFLYQSRSSRLKFLSVNILALFLIVFHLL